MLSKQSLKLLRHFFVRVRFVGIYRCLLNWQAYGPGYGYLTDRLRTNEHKNFNLVPPSGQIFFCRFRKYVLRIFFEALSHPLNFPQYLSFCWKVCLRRGPCGMVIPNYGQLIIVCPSYEFHFIDYRLYRELFRNYWNSGHFCSCQLQTFY